MMASDNAVTFCVWTENGPGIILRLTTLFTRRKISISSITASETEEEGIGRFTLVAPVEWELALKIARQIERVVEVQRVDVRRETDLVQREVAFYRVEAQTRNEALKLARDHDARVVHEDDKSLIIEKTGSARDIEDLRCCLNDLGLLEFLRSGSIAVLKQ